MSELLEAAAQVVGAPPELVQRSAEARADADGVPVEEVLAAWAGGEQCPPPHLPRPRRLLLSRPPLLLSRPPLLSRPLLHLPRCPHLRLCPLHLRLHPRLPAPSRRPGPPWSRPRWRRARPRC